MARAKIAVMISGRGSNLEALIRRVGTYEIRLVVADRPAEGLKYAEKAGIASVVLARENFANQAAHEQAIAERIEATGARWICLAGYMAVLSKEFIERFDGQIVNIHPSLLPDYKGLNTHARVLADKQAEHGASVHLVTPELDGGAVICQATCKIWADDDVASLSARVLNIEHWLLPMVMNAIGKKWLVIEKRQAVWKTKMTACVMPQNLLDMGVKIKIKF